jgi:hypothetical protein
MCFLLVGTTTASADLTRDLLGQWNSSSRTYYNGKSEGGRGSFTVRRTKNGTIRITSRDKRGRVTAEWYLYKSKRAYIALYETGEFMGEANGTWSVKSPRILFDLEFDILEGSASYYGSLRKQSRNKWGLIAIISAYGEQVRQVATLSRKR